MEPTILSTKIQIPPPRLDLVPRQRLIESLDHAAAHKLILICAPAGFGKTTIMSLWQADQEQPAAWLTLDLDDNNINRWLTYFTASLHETAPGLGEAMHPLLQSTQVVPVEMLLTVMINELASIPNDFFVIFDDYHLIDDPEIHAALSYLIDHQPANMHLVIASRSDPPLPISRLRARGELFELRQSDLRFTPDEAAEFLNQNIGLELSVDQISALEARTEGWIAGLQLAALSMRGRSDREGFIQAFSGSHRFIIDYLADEVFAQQSHDLRQFLLDTCIFDRFCSDLCNTITHRSDSEIVLRELEDNNLFISPLDDRRTWYRYHPLFRDFLSTRLDQQRKADLHSKAAEWFLSKGYHPEAVKHALASEDIALAEVVIDKAAAEAINQADFQSLLGWLNALPDEIVQSNISLATYKGLFYFLTRSYQEALPWARSVEMQLSTQTSASILGKWYCLRAHLAMWEGAFDECIQVSREALEYLDERDLSLRNLTLNVLGQVLEIKGDIAGAVEIYRQAFHSGWSAGDRLGAGVVFTNLVFGLNELGRRREAIQLCAQLVEEDDNLPGRSMQIHDALYLPWSLLEFEANSLELAGSYAQRALNLLEPIKFQQGITWAHYILARVNLAKGEFDQMREHTRIGQEIALQYDMAKMQGTWFAALEAQADLEGDKLYSALGWVEKREFNPEDHPHHWNEHSYFTYCRILIAQGQSEEAQTLLSTMEANAQQTGRNRKLISIYLLQALTHSAQDEIDKAVDLVERALGLAASQDYRRAFLDEGPKIAKLLPKARQTAPAFVDELMWAFRAPSTDTLPVDSLLDPLTGREQQVLELVAKGLSNREIAEVLVVSLGTVKKHLNNIFSKLAVKSRTQAVTLGRELGLLK